MNKFREASGKLATHEIYIYIHIYIHIHIYYIYMYIYLNFFYIHFLHSCVTSSLPTFLVDAEVSFLENVASPVHTTNGSLATPVSKHILVFTLETAPHYLLGMTNWLARLTGFPLSYMKQDIVLSGVQCCSVFFPQQCHCTKGG